MRGEGTESSVRGVRGMPVCARVPRPVMKAPLPHPCWQSLVARACERFAQTYKVVVTGGATR